MSLRGIYPRDTERGLAASAPPPQSSSSSAAFANTKTPGALRIEIIEDPSSLASSNGLAGRRLFLFSLETAKPTEVGLSRASGLAGFLAF